MTDETKNAAWFQTPPAKDTLWGNLGYTNQNLQDLLCHTIQKKTRSKNDGKSYQE